MSRFLDPSWWLWPLSQGFSWWLWAMVASAAALPLTLRLFRGLHDRGGGLAPVVGLFLPTWMAWCLASDALWSGEPVRFVLLGGGVIALSLAAYCQLAARLRHRPSLRAHPGWWAAGALLVLLALLRLPHAPAAIWLSVVLMLALGIASWWDDADALLRIVRRVSVPLGAALVIFTFFFFSYLHVRAGFPNVTFIPGDSGAEKFANLSHLSAVVQSRSMPPADPWFVGAPVNYYHGGHLMVGTVAKVTHTEIPRAFNLGLALVVAMTAAAGFSLTLNLAGPFARRRAIRGLRWTRGMGWGVLGALAVTAFGNLDALHQMIAGNNFDYWRSSRAIHGAPEAFRSAATITEFPAFSAILGDLHAHHMALPLMIALFCEAISMQFKMRRGAATARLWFRRCAIDLVVLGALSGMIAATNTWDVFVGLLFVPLAVLTSLRGTVSGRGWKWVSLFLVTMAVLWIIVLGVNLVRGSVPVLANPLAFLFIGVLVAAGVVWVGRAMERGHSPGQWVPAVAGIFVAVVFVAASGGFLNHRVAVPEAGIWSGLRMGLRDGLVVVVAMVGGIRLWSFLPRARLLALWFTALMGTALVALVVVSPFLLHFSPPGSGDRVLMTSMLPPILDPLPLVVPRGALTTFWEGTLIRPLPGELRTTLGDLLTHWGLFLLPVLLLAGIGLARSLSHHRRDVLFGVFGLALGGLSLALALFNAWAVSILLIALAGTLFLLVKARDPFRRLRWMFLLHAMAVLVFVELFYINDSMTGNYVRYNSYFKLTYALWPVLAALSVGLFADLWSGARFRPLPLRWGQRGIVLILVVAFLGLGLLYPRHAVLARGGHWLNPGEGAGPRTLDGLAWMERDARHSRDVELIRWLQFHGQPGDRLLEAPASGASFQREDAGHSYSAVGRMAAASGVPGLVGWSHHQYQWRGWNASINGPTGERLAPWFTLEELNLLSLTTRIFPDVPPTSGQLAELKRAAMHPRRANRRVVDSLLASDWTKEQREAVAAAFGNPQIGRLPIALVVQRLEEQAEQIYTAASLLPDQVQFLVDFGIRYVVVGDVEERRFGIDHPGLEKFRYWPVAFEHEGAAIHRVPGTEASE